MNKIDANLTGISLNNVGKKFRKQWIFKGINFHIHAGNKIAINGHNGSGKSTLLQIIGGYVSTSDGKVVWESQNGSIKDDAVYRYVALASPYMDLIDEFTFNENIDFFSD
ncbi:MAG: ATP-binding cassette domain-containing protein [Bacteroidetes bacterium]|nr:ATP-binding cassette domain-containing protein [Bacteroidota bacterium]